LKYKSGKILPSFRWPQHDLKTVFWGVPKCATSTVRDFLGIDSEGKNRVKSVPDGYSCFTVVRDPISRCCSAYCEAKRRNLTNDSFPIWLKELERNGWSDHHAAPIVKYLKGFRGKVFCITALDDLHYRISKWFGFDIPSDRVIDRSNVTSKIDRVYPSYDECLLIMSLYKTDADLLYSALGDKDLEL